MGGFCSAVVSEEAVFYKGDDYTVEVDFLAAFAGEADDGGVMRKGDVAIVGLSSSGRGRGSGFVVGLAVVLDYGVVVDYTVII